MKKTLLLIVCAFISAVTFAQKVGIDPVITPALFRHNDQITVTYNVTGTALASLNDAYIWVWIPGANINAKYNTNPANSTALPAKFTKNVSGGQTTFSVTFKPSDFFAGDISSQTKLGMLIKGTDWANGQSTDYVVNFWDGSFKIALTSPTERPLFMQNGEQISIAAQTPVTADFDLYVNNILIDEKNALTSYAYTHTVTQTTGSATVRLVATAGSSTSETSFVYLLPQNSPAVVRPAGIIPGINYHPDETKVTLCLLAPGKSSVYVLGDFSNWDVMPENLMNRDGEYFWIQLNGLTPETEYGFQYLVNQTLFLADPFADKILDPDDQYIPETVYPELKSYPEKALSDTWYHNRVAVFQTGQEEYTWMVENFEKPAKQKLVVYEALIRDMFDSDHRSYQSMIDTIAYFKELGVNAIELMPIMEFNGNESWGYNPTFMFAPDKYYGSKNKLKEFIDVCHQNGIAVILDIAMNHHDMPNPYVLMDFNFTTGVPNATNKWFNPAAKHPFNVFFDMNHESTYTKDYLDTVNYYWLNEYKVDGFRFDLSKGFTQQNNPNDVNAWSAYDASRIAILKRMADRIWEHSPDAYVILEHLSDNSEEKELAEYRSGEGKGMMLWGNMNHAYTQNTMGYAADSDIGRVSHKSRSWTVPHLVSYMESHDEERMMVRNLTAGNSGASGYTVRNVNTSLKRIMAASTMFYTVPGPKMLWQFGELGYDYSINYCEDGTVNNNCRVNPKPVRWDYYDVDARRGLFEHVSDLLRLRDEYDVFTSGDATFGGGNDLFKQITLKNAPYTENPASSEEMNAVVVANFNLTQTTQVVTFPHSGTWYNYYDDGSELQVSGGTASVTLKAGDFHLYTDVQIEDAVTSVEDYSKLFAVYPNPATGLVTIRSNSARVLGVEFFTQAGQKLTVSRIDNEVWNMGELSSGLYIIIVRTTSGVRSIKLFKRG